MGALAFAALVFLAGCKSPPAVIADVHLNAHGDQLCLLASDHGQVVYAHAYPAAHGALPPESTLVLVAGTQVSEQVRIAARLTRGGRTVAEGRGQSTFAVGGKTLPLDVSRCHRRDMFLTMPRVRRVATVPIGDGATVLGADIDGDGRDEILVADGNGGLVAIDAESAVGVPHPIGVAIPADARLSAAADGDGDSGCLLDLALASASGAVVVQAPGGDVGSFPGRGPSGVDLAVGDPTGDGDSSLVVPGMAGVGLLPWHGMGNGVMLDAVPSTYAVVNDLSGDGIDDVVVSGPGGTKLWRGGSGGPVDMSALLPAGFGAVDGPVAVGDLNDDGFLDLIGTAGSSLRVALGASDGSLRDATPAMTPTTTAAPVRLVVADINGDCDDDVTVLDADGNLLVLATEDPLSLVPFPFSLPAIRDVAAADVDGDGADELILLTTDGSVEVTGP